MNQYWLLPITASPQDAKGTRVGQKRNQRNDDLYRARPATCVEKDDIFLVSI